LIILPFGRPRTQEAAPLVDMPKNGHQLSSLIPRFPVQVSRKLNSRFSISMAEEFLGWASTQNPTVVASALGVSAQLLARAIRIARNAVEKSFLQELDKKSEEQFPTGALLDKPLPEWPVTFSIELKNKLQAETLSCALIRLERTLRRPISKGDFSGMNLADQLAEACRRLQEDAALVEESVTKTEPPEAVEFRRIYGRAPTVNWSKCLSVERTPSKVSGAWVFRGTRVPVHALFENLEGGATLDQFIEHFPGVTRKHVLDAIEFLLYSLEQRTSSLKSHRRQARKNPSTG
jgi:uncharacterized protein (DUF433 family)